MRSWRASGRIGPLSATPAAPPASPMACRGTPPGLIDISTKISRPEPTVGAIVASRVGADPARVQHGSLWSRSSGVPLNACWLPPQPVALHPEGLIQGLDGLSQFQPVATGPSVARHRRLTLGLFGPVD